MRFASCVSRSCIAASPATTSLGEAPAAKKRSCSHCSYRAERCRSRLPPHWQRLWASCSCAGGLLQGRCSRPVTTQRWRDAAALHTCSGPVPPLSSPPPPLPLPCVHVSVMPSARDAAQPTPLPSPPHALPAPSLHSLATAQLLPRCEQQSVLGCDWHQARSC